MGKVYLFDWGDTLMVDFPDQSGKMCDWEKVQAVDGAKDTLAHLSKTHQIYVATNAADSTEADIKRAFERVGLSFYIHGYFCKANLGIGKGSPAFFQKIIEKLNVPASEMVMVGDTIDKDIHPALQAGISAVWLNTQGVNTSPKDSYRQISNLTSLIE